MPWISAEKLAALTLKAEQCDSALKRAEAAPVLIQIHRDGRLNRFIFVRNNKHEVIETMGLLSDNIADWEARLLK